MRRWLFEVLIRELCKYLELGHISSVKEDDDAFLAQMWESPAFRRRLAERDSKIIFQMAGGENYDPLGHDQYLIHMGQRVETLLLGRDAKAAWNRTSKKRQDNITLAKAGEVPSS